MIERVKTAALCALIVAGLLAVASASANRPYRRSGRSMRVPLVDGTPVDGGPDGGVALLAYGLGASFADPGSVSGGPTYTTAFRCDGGPCAYFYDEQNAQAREAYEATDAGVGTFLVPAVQRWQAARVENGEASAVGYVHDAFPGTRTDAFSTTNLDAWDDPLAAAIVADHSGACIWPTIFFVDGGGYACQNAAQAFSTCWSGPVATLLSEIQLTAGNLSSVCPDWATSDIEVLYVSGGFQQFGTADNTWTRHGYTDNFISYQDATHHLCGTIAGVAVGGDGLHPNATGAGQIGDFFAQCAYRYGQGNETSPVELTAAAWQSATVLRLTFDVACRGDGTCANDPPIAIDTTNLVGQTTSGDVLTYGTHFYMSGTIQTPGAAVSSVSCSAASACTGSSCYCDLTFSADPGLTHDTVEVASTGEGTIGGSAHPGAGCSNFRAESSAAWPNTEFGDWPMGASVSANSRDGGPAPDSGVSPDAGSQTNVEYVDLPGSVYYTVPENNATLEAAEAMCFAAWVQMQTGNTHCFTCQWSADHSTSLNFWFGTSGFGVGFGNGTDWTDAVDSTDGWTHVAGCFQSAASGSGTITLWRDGVVDTGTSNGTLPSTLTDLDGPLEMDENAGGSADVWLDSVVWTTASGSSGYTHMWTTAQVERIFCATRNTSTHPDLGGGGCAAVTANLSDVCFLPGLWGYFPYEGDATAFCGTMALTANGTPTFTSY